MNKLILLGIILLLQGCATSVHQAIQQGKETIPSEGKVRLLLPPFYNATESEHAGRALTELTGTALSERGIQVYYPEASTAKSDEEDAGMSRSRYLQKAKEMKATHLLMGTVHEYHYKTDLNADPAVGITLHLIDVETGETAWQRSSAKVGYAFASLTSTAQRAVRDLVSKIPVGRK